MAFDPTKFGLKPVAPEQEGNLPSAMSSLRQEETMGVPSTTEGKDDNLLVKIGKALGMGSLGESIGRGLFKFTPESRRLDELIRQGKVASRESVLGKAPTTGQVVGSALQTAALGIPLGAAAGLSERALQFGGTGLVQGLGSAMEQEKEGAETVKQTLLTGVISAALPVVGNIASKTTKYVVPRIGEIGTAVLSRMTGKPEELIKQAFSHPEEVGVALKGKVIPLEARDSVISALKTAGNDAKSLFSEELTKLQKSFPIKKGEVHLELPDGTKQAVGGIFAPEVIQSKIGNVASSVSRIVRDFRIGITKSGNLDFDKLNSPIVSRAERKNIQEAVKMLVNLKDYTPEGMQAVATKLEKLQKFSEGPATESSAVLGKMSARFEEAIDRVYPQLTKIRSDYAVFKKMETGVRPLLREKGADTQAITSSIKRLKTLFEEDSIAYIRALQSLEQKTGKDLLSELAGSQLKSLAPGSFGSRIAEASLLAGGIFVNPMLLLTIPLFSPRVIGKGAVALGKLAKAGQKVVPKIAEIGAKTTDLRRVGLVELVKQLAK